MVSFAEQKTPSEAVMNTTAAKILVVDDEPSITEFVSYNLKK